MQKSARPRTQDVDPPWKRALDQNVRYLQDNLMLTESIYAYLIEENILTMEMIDMIKMSSGSKQDRVIELVNCLKERDEVCFLTFLDLLDATNNKHVVERLEQSMLPPSERGSSRQSISSEEMDNLLQSKDRKIQSKDRQIQGKDRLIEELESKLVAKDRRIKGLENVVDKLKLRLKESFELLRAEMQISDHYKSSRTVFRDDLQNVNEIDLESNEKGNPLKEAKGKVEELQLRVNELVEELKGVTDDLKTKNDELNDVLEKEKQMKKNLGLDENASDLEVMEHLKNSSLTRSELKRAKDELADINQKKIHLDDCLKTLAHQKDSLELELSQKKFEIERNRRTKEKRDQPPMNRSKLELLPWIKPLPRIDVNAYPQLPDPVGPMPSIPITQHRRLTPRFQPVVALESLRPKLQRRKTLASMEDLETKYCVLCRRNYYIKNECRIHIVPFVSGRFSCCGSEDMNCVGCKMVNHLYIHFTGLANEYTLYDDRGRPLDLKEQ